MKLADRVARLEQEHAALRAQLDAKLDNTVRCPYCKNTEVYKDGNYVKGGKRYVCRNPQCNRYFIIK